MLPEDWVRFTGCVWLQNAGAYVYAVAGVKGGKSFIDTCKVGFRVGLTMTAADLKLSTKEK